jgi:capsular polysaccharide transport system permease protein
MNDRLQLPDALKQPDLRTRLWQMARRHRGPLLGIGLPTLLTAIYYFVIAADLYASEARIVVHSPGHMQVSGLAGFLQGSGISRGQDDVYSVHDYMLSRDAMAALQKKIDLRAVFSRPEADFDFLARYPNLINHSNAEDFYRYYQRRVEVLYDTTTGITTVTVKAFRPEDAHAVASLLLDAAEDMVNRLNDRVRVNTVRDAEAEVKQVEEHVAEAQANMLAYRNRELLLDPGKTSGAMFENLSRMQSELSAARTRLAELDSTSPGSPLRSDLQTNIAVLQQQIDLQRGRLAGGDGSMAPKISEYDQLLLRQDFAAKELASALASLEAARAEARHQQIYLDRVVDADVPDKALYPKRIISVLIVLVSAFLIYSIGALLIAGVREHAQD